MQELEGVVSIHDTHFWTLCTDIHYGTAIVDILEGSDSQKILSATRSIFTQVRQFKMSSVTRDLTLAEISYALPEITGYKSTLFPTKLIDFWSLQVDFEVSDPSFSYDSIQLKLFLFLPIRLE